MGPRALDKQPPGVCGAPRCSARPASCSERLRAGELGARGPVPRVDAAGLDKQSPGALAGQRPAPSSPPHGGNPGEAGGAQGLCGRELTACARGPHSAACQPGALPLAFSDPRLGPVWVCAAVAKLFNLHRTLRPPRKTSMMEGAQGNTGVQGRQIRAPSLGQGLRCDTAQPSPEGGVRSFGPHPGSLGRLSPAECSSLDSGKRFWGPWAPFPTLSL